MKKRSLMPVIVLGWLWSSLAGAQVRHEIAIADLPGYQTLKCDFHMHTVFSDGVVWPTVRVQEAWRQGLDAIALTDHVEYQPHKGDVPTQHNRPFELAAGPARTMNLLFPRATEITRDTPPGHFNALFLDDVNPLETEDFVEVIRQANQQGAFVFWNHQGWKGEQQGRWLQVHTTLYENKWLHGMEVCNGESYYPNAHRWCLEKNLTMLGNSDIHDPDLRKQSTAADHRTLTLVFVKERTLASLKEALVEGRTAVWFGDQIIGRKEWLEPLFGQSVRIGKPHLRSRSSVWTAVQNVCDVDVKLQRRGLPSVGHSDAPPNGRGPAVLTLPARTTSLVKVDLSDPEEPAELAYTAVNFVIAPGEGLAVTLRVPAP